MLKSQFVVTWPMILAMLVTGQLSLVLQGSGFAGILDDEGAVGDLRLQDLPGAFEEQEGIVVGGCAGIQVQRVAGAGGLVDQVLGLGGAYGIAVEGDVVVDGIGAQDQAVIGDDLDAGLLGFFGGGRGGSAVLRGEDQDLDALGQQRFDVGLLLGGIALAEENLDGHACGAEQVLKAGLVLNPAGLILGGEHDADYRCAACSRSGGFGRGSCSITASGGSCRGCGCRGGACRNHAGHHRDGNDQQEGAKKLVLHRNLQ